MVIVKLSGGIGNQLFQYAAARRLSLKRNVPLKFDLTGFETEPSRRFALGIFDIAGQDATKDEIKSLQRHRIYGRRHLPLKLLERFGLIHLPRVYTHLDPAFYPKLLSAGGCSYLHGYWQSEEYFRDCSLELRKELTFRCVWRPEIDSLADAIQSQPCLSLHVRRGDYVADAANLATHGVCSPAYYREALDWCLTHHQVKKIAVFSDEPEWVAENLDLPEDSLIVSSVTLADYEDLYLMKCCRVHIIANSSFSWWGAWLSNAKPSQIVAPARWFANTALDSSKIVPSDWMRL